MDNQELRNYVVNSAGHNAFSFEALLKLIDRLDEPQKVKVPAYVAEWFETNKYVLDRAILDYMFEDYASDNSEFGKWFDNKNGKPIETLARMLDGYEVEEEPKYYVNIGDLYLKEPLGDTSDFTISMTWNREYAYPFDSWNMAREHASELGGTVEKV